MRLAPLLATILLAGCASDVMDLPDGAPAPSRCDSARYAGAPSAAIRVGELEQGEFVSFDDDPVAEFEWGFQGGTMIQPVIGVPLAVAGDERCFSVTVRHHPDPAAPEAFGGVAAFPEMQLDVEGEADAEAVWLGPLLDQIGIDDLGGTRLLLDVTVRGTRFAAQHEVAIEVSGEPPIDEPEVCRALDRDPGSAFSCGYLHIPGTGRVITRDPAGREPGQMCVDPIELEVEFTPDDPAVEVCVTHELPIRGVAVLSLERLGWQNPPSSCLNDVEVGGEVRVILHSVYRGTCSPAWLELDRPTCETACSL